VSTRAPKAALRRKRPPKTKTVDDDPIAIIETVRAEVARVRGWLSMGDHGRAETALDAAMVALTDAEDACPEWARPMIEQAHAELDRAISSTDA